MADALNRMAADESIHTTDGNYTNIADLMQSGLASIATAIGAIPALDAANITYDNSTSGLAATYVGTAIDELASEKADSATTLAGYGITDAYTQTETDNLLSAKQDTLTAGAGIDITGNTISVDATASEITFDDTKAGLGVNNTQDAIDALNDNLTDSAQTVTATGESFALTPTSEGNILAHTIYGMSEQDGTPTPSSPVDIDSAVANFECAGKNLLPYPYYVKSQTLNEVTFTINDDGTVTVDGTATANTFFYLVSKSFDDALTLPTGQYIISGCPSGGSDSGYYFGSAKNVNGTRSNSGRDYGSELTLDVIDDGNTRYDFQIAVMNGVTVSNLVFKPMLRLASVTDSTYEPYQATTAETDLTLRAIEVTSSDDYNLVRGGKYYIADSVDWSEDDGYVLTRRVKEVTLDGTESGWSTGAATYGDVYLIPVSDGSNDATYGLCDYFEVNSDGGQTEVGRFTQMNDRLYFDYAEHGTTSLSDFTTWLASNPITVDYILATPTTESLTAEQAEALLSLKTYDTATSINCTADVSPTIEIEYAKERVPALALSGHNESALAVDWASENVLGAKNLIPYPYTNGGAGAVWSTNGVDFTVNADGSIDVNGTATADAYFRCGISTQNSNPIPLKKSVSYIISGTGSDNVYIKFRDSNNSSVATINAEDYFYNCTETGDYYILLIVPKGKTANHEIIKPMLRLASIKDPTYAPYAMTNKELTDAVKCNQTTAGTYTLQATVDANGNVTYSWV